MIVEANSVVSSLLAFAAYLLGLSVLVQVLQEFIKFLCSTKAAVYQRVIRDAVGPLWSLVERSHGAVRLHVRGPSQFIRLGPRGKLLPLDLPSLTDTLEGAAPTWVQRTLARLREETVFQRTFPGQWSPSWSRFLEELAEVPKGSAGYWTAQDILRFLGTNGQPQESSSASSPALSAEQLVGRFRAAFLPDVVAVEAAYPQLVNNFEYSYRRRNLLMSFLLGWFVAVALSLPVDRIWQRATELTPAQAIALASELRQLAAAAAPSEAASAANRETNGSRAATPEGDVDQPTASAPRAGRSGSSQVAPPATPAASPPGVDCAALTAAVETLDRSLQAMAGAERRPAGRRIQFFAQWKESWRSGIPDFLAFLPGYLITAVLLSFGAPFWNDAIGILSKFQGGTKSQRRTAEE
ncbi:MAG: hypothetical protein HRF46_12045 [Acidobacteriota bacterium]|jgi:hypothetical protein